MAVEQFKSSSFRSKVIQLVLTCLALSQHPVIFTSASAIRAEQNSSAADAGVESRKFPVGASLTEAPTSSPLDRQKAVTLTVASSETAQAESFKEQAIVITSLGNGFDKVSPSLPTGHNKRVSQFGVQDGRDNNGSSFSDASQEYRKRNIDSVHDHTAPGSSVISFNRSVSTEKDFVNRTTESTADKFISFTNPNAEDRNSTSKTVNDEKKEKKDEINLSVFLHSDSTNNTEISITQSSNKTRSMDDTADRTVPSDMFSNLQTSPARPPLAQTGEISDGDDLDNSSKSSYLLHPTISQEGLPERKEETNSSQLQGIETTLHDAYISKEFIKAIKIKNHRQGTFNDSDSSRDKGDHSSENNAEIKTHGMLSGAASGLESSTSRTTESGNATNTENQQNEAYNSSKKIELVSADPKIGISVLDSKIPEATESSSSVKDSSPESSLSGHNDTISPKLYSTRAQLSPSMNLSQEGLREQGHVAEIEFANGLRAESSQPSRFVPSAEKNLTDRRSHEANPDVFYSAPASLERSYSLIYNNSIVSGPNVNLNQSRAPDGVPYSKLAASGIDASVNITKFNDADLNNINLETGWVENKDHPMKQAGLREENLTNSSSGSLTESPSGLDVTTEASMAFSKISPMVDPLTIDEKFLDGFNERSAKQATYKPTTTVDSMSLSSGLGQPRQNSEINKWPNTEHLTDQRETAGDYVGLQKAFDELGEVVQSSEEPLSGLSWNHHPLLPGTANLGETIQGVERIFPAISEDFLADASAEKFLADPNHLQNSTSNGNQTVLSLPKIRSDTNLFPPATERIAEKDVTMEYFTSVENATMATPAIDENIKSLANSLSSPQPADTDYKRLEQQFSVPDPWRFPSGPGSDTLKSSNSDLEASEILELADKQPVFSLPVSPVPPVSLISPASAISQDSPLSQSSPESSPLPLKPLPSQRPDLKVPTSVTSDILSQSRPLASRLHAVEQLTAGKEFEGKKSIVAKLEAIMKELVKKLNLNQAINTTFGKVRNSTESPILTTRTADEISGPLGFIDRNESKGTNVDGDLFSFEYPDFYPANLSDDIDSNKRLLELLSQKLNQNSALNSDIVSITQPTDFASDNAKVSQTDNNRNLLAREESELQNLNQDLVTQQLNETQADPRGRGKQLTYFPGYGHRSTPDVAQTLSTESTTPTGKLVEKSVMLPTLDTSRDYDTDASGVSLNSDNTISAGNPHGNYGTIQVEEAEVLGNKNDWPVMNVREKLDDANNGKGLLGAGGTVAGDDLYKRYNSNGLSSADGVIDGSGDTTQQSPPSNYQNYLFPAFDKNKEYVPQATSRSYERSDLNLGDARSRQDIGFPDKGGQNIGIDQRSPTTPDKMSFSKKYAEWQELLSHNLGADIGDRLEMEHSIPRTDERMAFFTEKGQPLASKDSQHQSYGTQIRSRPEIAPSAGDITLPEGLEPFADFFPYQDDQIMDFYPGLVYDSSKLYDKYEPINWGYGGSDINNFKSVYPGVQDSTNHVGSVKLREGNSPLSPSNYFDSSRGEITQEDPLKFSNENELPRLIQAEIWSKKQQFPTWHGPRSQSQNQKQRGIQSLTNAQQEYTLQKLEAPLSDGISGYDSVRPTEASSLSDVTNLLLSSHNVVDEPALPDEADDTKRQKPENLSILSKEIDKELNGSKQLLSVKFLSFDVSSNNLSNSNLSSIDISSKNVNIAPLQTEQPKIKVNGDSTRDNILLQERQAEEKTSSKDLPQSSESSLKLPAPFVAFQKKRPNSVQFSSLVLNISNFSGKSSLHHKNTSHLNSLLGPSVGPSSSLQPSRNADSVDTSTRMDGSYQVNTSKRSEVTASENLTPISSYHSNHPKALVVEALGNTAGKRPLLHRAEPQNGG